MTRSLVTFTALYLLGAVATALAAVAVMNQGAGPMTGYQLRLLAYVVFHSAMAAATFTAAAIAHSPVNLLGTALFAVLAIAAASGLGRT